MGMMSPAAIAAPRMLGALRASAPVPLSATFEIVGRHAPRASVSADAFARVLATMEMLPAALTSWVYLETRLARDAPQVDVVLHIEEAGRAILAGENPRVQLARALRAHPAWHRVTEFCREWGDPTSPLHRNVDHIWLEIDVPSDAGAADAPVPVPGIFICFDERRPVDYGAREWYHRALAALESLEGAPVPIATAEQLRRCFVHLPDSSYVPYVGRMLGRAGDAIRMCVNDIPDEKIPDYLEAIGWAGSPTQLAAAMRDFKHAREGARSAGVGMLHIDVGPEVQPRIGLEYSLLARPQYSRTIAEHGFLDHLVSRGLCDGEKRAHLGDWLGHTIETFPHEIWKSVAVRRINHIKIVYDASGIVEAKAYLLGCFRYYKAGEQRLDTRREQFAVAAAGSSLGGFPS